jgi:DNA-binding LytR/AlgR family response regulator
MRIKTVIVEDERHSLERLRDVLSSFEGLEIAGEATDGLTAVKTIDKIRPDLVFLDIQMPGCSGFEVLARISIRPMVIFVTAYDQYALKAFDENAVDYILKPSSRERIAAAVERALARHQLMDSQLLEALREALFKRQYLQRFLVKVGDEMLIIPESEVFYFKAEGKYVFLRTDAKEFIIDMTLKELEQRLDPDLFCRVHKSHIVSLSKIKKISKWFHGEQLIEVSDRNSTRLRLGRNFQAKFREKLKT